MNFIELYYILSLLRYMYMYMHISLLSSLLSLLFKLYVLVYHKIFMCMNINKYMITSIADGYINVYGLCACF